MTRPLLCRIEVRVIEQRPGSVLQNTECRCSLEVSAPVCDCVCLQASEVIVFYGVSFGGYSVLDAK